MWALADELAGKSLGQAAPLLPSLSSVITDVVPIDSPSNVAGSIVDSDGTFDYTAKGLVEPVYSSDFYSALWDTSGTGAGEFVDISFSTDTTLLVGHGWDYVTGYGVPQDYHFIQAAAALK